MYKQFYAGMDFSHFPLFALWLFLAVFAGVCTWVLVVRRAKDFDPLSRLPLGDENE
jgi:cytochrome c oxidase cbb3-type subunit 4